MTPKEKAIELVDRFEHQYDLTTSETIGIKGIDYETAKQCALIAVGEILNNIDFTSMLNGTDDYNYWLQVKQEIDEL
jgi:hypothetical protein